MPRLIQLIRIQTETQPNRRAGIKLSTIRQRRNPTIINLNLRERQRVKLILRRQLQPTGFRGLHIVPRLDSHFGGGVDFLVEGGGEDAQILDARDAGDVVGGLISEGDGVASYGRFLEVVAGFTSDEEAFVAGGHVHDGVDVAVVVAVVEEGAGVDVGVFEGEGEFFRARDRFVGAPEVLEVDFYPRGDDVGEFDFAVEDCGGGPAFGDGHACVAAGQRRFLLCAIAAVGHVGDCEEEFGVLGAG